MSGHPPGNQGGGAPFQLPPNRVPPQFSFPHNRHPVPPWAGNNGGFVPFQAQNFPAHTMPAFQNHAMMGQQMFSPPPVLQYVPPNNFAHCYPPYQEELFPFSFAGDHFGNPDQQPPYSHKHSLFSPECSEMTEARGHARQPAHDVCLREAMAKAAMNGVKMEDPASRQGSVADDVKRVSVSLQPQSSSTVGLGISESGKKTSSPPVPSTSPRLQNKSSSPHQTLVTKSECKADSPSSRISQLANDEESTFDFHVIALDGCKSGIPIPQAGPRNVRVYSREIDCLTTSAGMEAEPCVPVQKEVKSAGRNTSNGKTLLSPHSGAEIRPFFSPSDHGVYSLFGQRQSRHCSREPDLSRSGCKECPSLFQTNIECPFPQHLPTGKGMSVISPCIASSAEEGLAINSGRTNSLLTPSIGLVEEGHRQHFQKQTRPESVKSDSLQPVSPIGQVKEIRNPAKDSLCSKQMNPSVAELPPSTKASSVSLKGSGVSPKGEGEKPSPIPEQNAGTQSSIKTAPNLKSEARVCPGVSVAVTAGSGSVASSSKAPNLTSTPLGNLSGTKHDSVSRPGTSKGWSTWKLKTDSATMDPLPASIKEKEQAAEKAEKPDKKKLVDSSKADVKEIVSLAENPSDRAEIPEGWGQKSEMPVSCIEKVLLRSEGGSSFDLKGKETRDKSVQTEGSMHGERRKVCDHSQSSRKVIDLQTEVCRLRAQLCLNELQRERFQLELDVYWWKSNFQPAISGPVSRSMTALQEHLQHLMRQVRQLEVQRDQCLRILKSGRELQEVPNFAITFPNGEVIVPQNPFPSTTATVSKTPSSSVPSSLYASSCKRTKLEVGAEPGAGTIDGSARHAAQPDNSGMLAGKQASTPATVTIPSSPPVTTKLDAKHFLQTGDVSSGAATTVGLSEAALSAENHLMSSPRPALNSSVRNSALVCSSGISDSAASRAVSSALKLMERSAACTVATVAGRDASGVVTGGGRSSSAKVLATTVSSSAHVALPVEGECTSASVSPAVSHAPTVSSGAPVIKHEPTSASVTSVISHEPISASVTSVISHEPISASVTPVKNHEPISASVTSVIRHEPISASVTSVISHEPISTLVTSVKSREPTSASVTSVKSREPTSASVTAVKSREPTSASVTSVISREPTSTSDTPVVSHEPVSTSGISVINLDTSSTSDASSIIHETSSTSAVLVSDQNFSAFSSSCAEDSSSGHLHKLTDTPKSETAISVSCVSLSSKSAESMPILSPAETATSSLSGDVTLADEKPQQIHSTCEKMEQRVPKKEASGPREEPDEHRAVQETSEMSDKGAAALKLETEMNASATAIASSTPLSSHRQCFDEKAQSVSDKSIDVFVDARDSLSDVTGSKNKNDSSHCISVFDAKEDSVRDTKRKPSLKGSDLPPEKPVLDQSTSSPHDSSIVSENSQFCSDESCSPVTMAGVSANRTDGTCPQKADSRASDASVKQTSSRRRRRRKNRRGSGVSQELENVKQALDSVSLHEEEDESDDVGEDKSSVGNEVELDIAEQRKSKLVSGNESDIVNQNDSNILDEDESNVAEKDSSKVAKERESDVFKEGKTKMERDTQHEIPQKCVHSSESVERTPMLERLSVSQDNKEAMITEKHVLAKEVYLFGIEYDTDEDQPLPLEGNRMSDGIFPQEPDEKCDTEQLSRMKGVDLMAEDGEKSGSTLCRAGETQITRSVPEDVALPSTPTPPPIPTKSSTPTEPKATLPATSSSSGHTASGQDTFLIGSWLSSLTEETLSGNNKDSKRCSDVVEVKTDSKPVVGKDARKDKMSVKDGGDHGVDKNPATEVKGEKGDEEVGSKSFGTAAAPVEESGGTDESSGILKKGMDKEVVLNSVTEKLKELYPEKARDGQWLQKTAQQQCRLILAQLNAAPCPRSSSSGTVPSTTQLLSSTSWSTVGAEVEQPLPADVIDQMTHITQRGQEEHIRLEGLKGSVQKPSSSTPPLAPQTFDERRDLIRRREAILARQREVMKQQTHLLQKSDAVQNMLRMLNHQTMADPGNPVLVQELQSKLKQYRTLLDEAETLGKRVTELEQEQRTLQVAAETFHQRVPSAPVQSSFTLSMPPLNSGAPGVQHSQFSFFPVLPPSPLLPPVAAGSFSLQPQTAPFVSHPPPLAPAVPLMNATDYSVQRENFSFQPVGPPLAKPKTSSSRTVFQSKQAVYRKFTRTVTPPLTDYTAGSTSLPHPALAQPPSSRSVSGDVFSASSLPSFSWSHSSTPSPSFPATVSLPTFKEAVATNVASISTNSVVSKTDTGVTFRIAPGNTCPATGKPVTSLLSAHGSHGGVGRSSQKSVRSAHGLDMSWTSAFKSFEIQGVKGSNSHQSSSSSVSAVGPPHPSLATFTVATSLTTQVSTGTVSPAVGEYHKKDTGNLQTSSSSSSSVVFFTGSALSGAGEGKAHSSQGSQKDGCRRVSSNSSSSSGESSVRASSPEAFAPLLPLKPIKVSANRYAALGMLGSGNGSTLPKTGKKEVSIPKSLTASFSAAKSDTAEGSSQIRGKKKGSSDLEVEVETVPKKRNVDDALNKMKSGPKEQEDSDGEAWQVSTSKKRGSRGSAKKNWERQRQRTAVVPSQMAVNVKPPPGLKVMEQKAVSGQRSVTSAPQLDRFSFSKKLARATDMLGHPRPNINTGFIDSLVRSNEAANLGKGSPATGIPKKSFARGTKSDQYDARDQPEAGASVEEDWLKIKKKGKADVTKPHVAAQGGADFPRLSDSNTSAKDASLKITPYRKLYLSIADEFPHLQQEDILAVIHEVKQLYGGHFHGKFFSDIMKDTRTVVLRQYPDKLRSAKQSKPVFREMHTMNKEKTFSAGKKSEGIWQQCGNISGTDFQSAEDECSICLLEFSTESPYVLDCGHNFHKQCIDKWVKDQGERTCPNCRTIVLMREEFPHLGRDASS